MDIKLIEIRDRGTCMPALAIRTSPADEGERWLLQRSGFGKEPTKQAGYILLAPLVGLEKGHIYYDYFQWEGGFGRTLFQAHDYLLDHFDEVRSGDVVDIEYILRETPAPKRPEREDAQGTARENSR